MKQNLASHKNKDFSLTSIGQSHVVVTDGRPILDINPPFFFPSQLHFVQHKIAAFFFEDPKGFR